MNIVTVTPNTAIDTTLFLDNFQIGEFNRAVRVEHRPGGKGNNVARILKQLGHNVIATGFVGGSTGQWIEHALHDAGIQTAFVPVEGRSRMCYAFVESRTQRATEVVEPGPRINAVNAQKLLDTVQELSDWADAIVMSGSLPTGLTQSYYACLVEAARSNGHAIVALDTSGNALRAGITAKPHLIKPNLRELESLIGTLNGNMDVLVHRIQELVLPNLAPGGFALVSMGAQGLLEVDRDGYNVVPAPQITIVNTVGCGDALLAGFIHSYLTGHSMLDAMKYAVACGSAAALQGTAGDICLDDVNELLNRIQHGRIVHEPHLPRDPKSTGELETDH